MGYYFYTDTDGQKRGPVSNQKLKALVTQGVITPETRIETGDGKSALAKNVKGLEFPPKIESVQPLSPQVIQSIPVTSPAEPNPLIVVPSISGYSASPNTGDSEFGKALVSGNGKRNKAFLTIFCVYLSIAIFVFAFLMATYKNKDYHDIQKAIPP